MRLNNLKIYILAETEDYQVIRDIDLIDGLNIITNKPDEPGNQIGKTTFLNVINFCLGSHHKGLWYDYKKEEKNIDVHDYIFNNNLIFQLSITHQNLDIIIKRQLFQKETKNGLEDYTINWINDELITGETNFALKLKSLFFPSDSPKPTYSTLKNRFLRIDIDSFRNPYKYLSKFTKSIEYKAIYCYFFGFQNLDDINEEQEILKIIKKSEIRINSLLNGFSLEEYRKRLSEINIRIESLENAISELNIDERYKSELSELKNLRNKLVQLQDSLASIDLRINYNQLSLEKYKTKILADNLNSVREIYSTLKIEIPTITKNIDEVINFHNTLLNEKIHFTENRLYKLISEKNEIENRSNKLIILEKEMLSRLNQKGAFDSILKIEKDIQIESEKKGRVLNIIEETSKELANIRKREKEHEKIRKNISSMKSVLIKNLNSFNKFYRVYAKELFQIESKFDIYFDENNDISLNLINSDKITGHGAPRAEIFAFDLAFIHSIEENRKGYYFNFTIQDNIESIDEDKLKYLLELSNRHKSQVIVSVLRDKLNIFSSEFISENRILELSGTNKLFKI